MCFGKCSNTKIFPMLILQKVSFCSPALLPSLLITSNFGCVFLEILELCFVKFIYKGHLSTLVNSVMSRR